MANRQDRMAQRLRGAQRHRVEEADFGFVLPDLDLGFDLGLDAPVDGIVDHLAGNIADIVDNIAENIDAATATDLPWPVPALPIDGASDPELGPAIDESLPNLQQPEPQIKVQTESEPKHQIEPQFEHQIESPSEPASITTHSPAVDAPGNTSPHAIANGGVRLSPRFAQSTHYAERTSSPQRVEQNSSDGPTVAAAREPAAHRLPSPRTSPRLSQQRTRDDGVLQAAAAVPDGHPQSEGEITANETGPETVSPPNNTSHDKLAKKTIGVQPSAHLPVSGLPASVAISSATSSPQLSKESHVSADEEEQQPLSSSPVARLVKRNEALGRPLRKRSWSSGKANSSAGIDGAITEQLLLSNESVLYSVPSPVTSGAEAEPNIGESASLLDGPSEGHTPLDDVSAPLVQHDQPNGVITDEAAEEEATTPVDLVSDGVRQLGRKRKLQLPEKPQEPTSQTGGQAEPEPEPDQSRSKRRRKQAPAPTVPPPTRNLRATRARSREMDQQPPVLVEKALPVEKSLPVRPGKQLRPESETAKKADQYQSLQEDIEQSELDVRNRTHEASATAAEDVTTTTRTTTTTRKATKAAKTTKTRGRPAAARTRAKRIGESKESIPIRIQRFRKQRPDENNPDAIDILTADIPFTQRRTPNTVDVLTQVCHETIDDILEKNAVKMQQAPTAAEKKQLRIQLRAVEAFREQLAHSLLEHTIHLEKLYSLRQGVRQSLKIRNQLQDDVIRMRRERDEIKMQIEAIKAQHQVKEEEARRRLDISTAMNDMDLAIEKGKAAPELSAAEQKIADLTSLEAQMARLADHVSSSSTSGGILRVVKDFNAFLERAAQTLEGKA